MARKKQKVAEPSDAGASSSSSTQQQEDKQQSALDPITVLSSGSGWAQKQQPLSGLEDLPKELLAEIRDLIRSDQDLVSLSCASPVLRRGLLHEDEEVWDRLSSYQSCERQDKLDDDSRFAHLTAKERCQTLGNSMCWLCHKHVKRSEREGYSLKDEARCLRCQTRLAGSVRSPDALSSDEDLKEAMEFFGLTQAEILDLKVYHFVTEWNAHGSRVESYTLNHRGVRRALKGRDVDLFVLERPKDGSLSASKSFRRWDDAYVAWFGKLNEDRFEMKVERQMALDKQLETAGVAVENCRDDPVYEELARNNRFGLRLVGLRNKAAAIDELLKRQKEDRLGAPLPPFRPGA